MEILKKIVINKDFGGFGLSASAVKRYLELNGQECYFFKVIEKNDEFLSQITLEEAQEDIHWVAFTVPDPEKHINFKKPWNEMTDEEKEEYQRTWSALSFYSQMVDRDDPKLIQVVEELEEKANAKFAKLGVVLIPEDVEWIIQQYDGKEWIAEKHRRWE